MLQENVSDFNKSGILPDFPSSINFILMVASGVSQKNTSQINRSNRSFPALQIGQISGACSRAQRYPQTEQRQTGNGRELDITGYVCIRPVFTRSDRGGRRSGTGPESFFPFTTVSLT